MEDIRRAAALLSSTAAVTRVSTALTAITEATKLPAFRVGLLGSFATASLLLAAIGVYGVVSQSVSMKTREVGIRLALGASATNVVRSVTRQVVMAALAGSIGGSVVALLFARTMRALLYGVRANDDASWLAAATILAIVTGVAALVPALRATRIHPMEALRAD